MAPFYKGLQRDAVEQLVAANVCRYLLDTGWERVENLPERVASDITVFRRQREGELQEVIVPLNRQQREHYCRRMAEAVSDLAEYEGRTPGEVVGWLANE